MAVLPESLQPGHVLAGRFRLIRLLGQGAIGNVWLAHDQALDDDCVAVKALNISLTDDRKAVSDLKREVLLTRRLRHPYILAVYTFWPGEGLSFITMEYVHGPSLAHMLAERGRPFFVSDTIAWTGQLCSALDYAHRQGVLHRDIKPSNIIVDDTDTLRLVDFGIARTLRDLARERDAERTSGTINFMSPEQLQGRPIDQRSDLYSLAATLYELLSGRPPFYRGDVAVQLQLKPAESIPGVPRELNEVLLRALEKNPADRQRSCGEFFLQYEAAARRSGDAPANTGMAGGARAAMGAVPLSSAGATQVLRKPDIGRPHRRLGSLLLEHGLVTERQLADALLNQRDTGHKLGAILAQEGFISEDDVARFLMEQLDLPEGDLSETALDHEIISMLPREIYEDHNCLPLRRESGRIVVAMADPLDVRLIDDLERRFGCTVEPHVVTPGRLGDAIARLDLTM